MHKLPMTTFYMLNGYAIIACRNIEDDGGTTAGSHWVGAVSNLLRARVWTYSELNVSS